MRTAYTAKGLLPSQQPCFIFRLFGASAGLIITLKLELAVVHAENTVCTVGDSKVVGNHDEGQTEFLTGLEEKVENFVGVLSVKVGSSAMMMSGLLISARAIATRCC